MDGIGNDDRPAAGKRRDERPADGSGPVVMSVRFTRPQALMGLAALGIFYWGAVGTLVGYRLNQTGPGGCHARCLDVPPLRERGSTHPPERRFHRGDWPVRSWIVPPGPAWDPHPQPRVIGLHFERMDGQFVGLAR